MIRKTLLQPQVSRIESRMSHLPQYLVCTYSDILRQILIVMGFIMLILVWPTTLNTITTISIGGPFVFYSKHCSGATLFMPCLRRSCCYCPRLALDNTNISWMPINVCHASLGYTCFRIPQSCHLVDPAAITTGASWSGSYCNIPKRQLFSSFLTITNKHARVNTDRRAHSNTTMWPHPSQKTKRKEIRTCLMGTCIAFPSDWPLS